MFSISDYSTIFLIIIIIIFIMIPSTCAFKNKEGLCNSLIKTNININNAYNIMKNGDIIFILDNDNKIVHMFLLFIIDDQVSILTLDKENYIRKVPLYEILTNIGKLDYDNISENAKIILDKLNSEKINNRRASKIILLKRISSTNLPLISDINLQIPRAEKINVSLDLDNHSVDNFGINLFIAKYMNKHKLLTYPNNVQCISDPSICYSPLYKNTAFIKNDHYDVRHLFLIIND